MKCILATVLMLLPTLASADLVHNFKNPSFSGNGYSNHVLSIEQLQFNRQKDIDDAIAAEEARIERELENSTLNKFLRNVESRIYATLSKQMVDAMFEACGEGREGSNVESIPYTLHNVSTSDGSVPPQSPPEMGSSPASASTAPETLDAAKVSPIAASSDHSEVAPPSILDTTV